MTKNTERLFNPLIVVSASVIISVSLYYMVAIILHLKDFLAGLIISAIIPIAVSLPISLVMIRYHKQIRKQKNELERLVASNKKLFSLISHDLRSPIASLKTILDIILKEDLNKDEQIEYLDTLSAKTGNVLHFIDDMLKWAQQQSENKPLEFKSFSSKEVIKKICELFGDFLSEKHIKLETGELDNSVFADKESYSFIFRNIFHNAIKFTPEKGKITVFTKIIDDHIHTVIKDSGKGMSEEDIKVILDRDELYTREGTSGEIGTGFGINTCQNYLKDNNGTLQIESKPGKGSTITFILPCKMPAQ